MREALFFDELDDDTIRCELCPHLCVLKPNQVGICKVRKNVHGVLYSLNYGMVSAAAMDPIEKKPLFHFHPGESIFSVGSWGCNMSCPFCQNWEISQEKPKIRNFSSAQLVSIAQGNDSFGIAYTYSEPVVWFEYVLDCARNALKEGLANVMITNGYIEEQPFKLLTQYFSAMNIDLKSFDEGYYKKVLHGERNVVMKNISFAHESGVHVEVTKLVVPQDNDSLSEMEELSRWLASVDRSIPLHLSRYYPNYKYDRPPTDVEKMEELYEIAKNYLDFVYIGNIPGVHEDTVCPECGQTVIKRNGYDVEIVGLDENGRCTNCGHKIAIR